MWGNSKEIFAAYAELTTLLKQTSKLTFQDVMNMLLTTTAVKE